ncbi:SlyX family protein [Flavobacterium restrictum]|uniref:SlyX family protein n=1 Tax=Flavobacterium restrictum TaxID=2594428 RepID=A0A553EAQ5_9FLAO|nr:SlyX family protein [Flavobacterium restrictum]TRX42154.1 SlyX family protein [Flavobacterium restrictum]
MKKITRFVITVVLFLSPVIAFSQISTNTGGAANVLPNSPTTNANVGIGTNTPKSKLDVEGGVSIGTNYSGSFVSPANGLIVEGNIGIGTTLPLGVLDVKGGLSDGQIFTSAVDSYLKSTILNIGSIRDTQNGTRLLTFFDIPSSNLNPKSQFVFKIEDRANMNRFKISAMVGDYSDLELNNATQQTYFRVSSNGGDFSYLEMPKADSHFVIGGSQAWPIVHKFWVKAGSSKFEGDVFVDTNIGIGTANFVDGTDTYRLSVKGKIRAEEIKVYTTWADYVFNKGYKLPSLKEVESYIATNGHLQNVPSEKEITEKGLELGEMAKIQQEKIEELTLYLIQQNKDIEVLKAQVKLLLENKQ